jgi:hypothetical protein
LSAVASKDLDQIPTFRHFGNNSFAEQVCAVLVQRHCETQEIQVEIDIFDTYFQRVSTRKDCQSIFSTPDVVTWQSAGTHKSSCLGVKNIHLEQLIIFENQCDSFLLFFLSYCHVSKLKVISVLISLCNGAKSCRISGYHAKIDPFCST